MRIATNGRAASTEPSLPILTALGPVLLLTEAVKDGLLFQKGCLSYCYVSNAAFRKCVGAFLRYFSDCQ